jgi:hypothetical protein
MEIINNIIETEVKAIYYNGEPIEKEKFLPGGEYYQENYLTTLSQSGIEQIGKLIKQFQIYIKDSGWFTCECY